MNLKDTALVLATLYLATAIPMPAAAQETTLSSKAVAAKMAGTWLAKEGDIVIGFTFGDQGSIELIEYGEVSHRGHYKINTEVSPWQIDFVWEMHGQTKALYSVFEMTIDGKLRMPSPKSSVDNRPAQASIGLAFTKGAAPVSSAQKPASEIEIKAAMKKLAGSWNGDITLTFGEDGSLQMSRNGVVKAKGVYTVDPAQNPMHMTWWPEGQGLDKTIYVLDGDKLKIAATSHRQRPTDFTGRVKEFTRGATSTPGGGAAAIPAGGAGAEAVMKKLAGVWTSNVLKDELTMTFGADGSLTIGTGKRQLKGTYTVDPSQTPMHLDLLPAGEAPDKTIFELAGDTLKIAEPKHQNRPTVIKSPEFEFTRSAAGPAGVVPAAGADPQAKLLAKMAGTWRGEVLDTPVVITLTANGGFSMKVLKLSTGEVKINMETKPWQIDFIPADPADKTTYAFFEILADGKMRMTLPITARTAKRSKFEDFEDAVFILTKGPEGK